MWLSNRSDFMMRDKRPQVKKFSQNLTKEIDI